MSVVVKMAKVGKQDYGIINSAPNPGILESGRNYRSISTSKRDQRRFKGHM